MGAFSLTPPELLDGLFAAALAVVVIAIAKIDCERFEIPDWANLAVFGLGVARIAVTSFDIAGELAEVLARSAVFAAFFCATKFLYYRLRKVDGLGWGDVKLAAAGSSWLSLTQAPVALLIAAGGGLLVAVVQIVRGSTVPLNTAIPFGAFLAPAIWIVWVAGLLDWL